MAKVAQTILLALVIIFLILIFIFCKRKIYPKCCNCFKKLVNLVMNKMMFNSLLRSLIMTYLANSVSVWSALLSADTQTKGKKIELATAILLLVVLLAYPIWASIFLKKNIERIWKPEVRAKYDSIY